MFLKIDCILKNTTLTNEIGREVNGVVVTCSRCGQKTRSYGQGPNSVKRCLALMREKCPDKLDAFYAIKRTEYGE